MSKWESLEILLVANLDEKKSLDSLNKAINKIQTTINNLDLKIKIDDDIFKDLTRQLTTLKNTLKNSFNLSNDFKKTSAALRDINSAEKDRLRIMQLEHQLGEKINRQKERKIKLTNEEKFANIQAYQEKEFLLKQNKFQNKYEEKFYDPAELNRIVSISDRLEKIAKDTNYDWQQIRNEIRNSGQEMRILDNNAKNAKNEFESMTKASDELFDSVKKCATQFITWEAIFLGQRAIKDMIDTVIELDDSMIQLKKVSEETEATYDKFQQTAFKAASQMGVTTKEFIDASSEWARTGASIKDISENLAIASTLYSKVGDDIDTVTATQVLVSTMQGFNLENEKAIDIIDELNNVSNKFAVSSDNLGEILRRSASSMAVANTTLEETIALGASAHVVVQDAESIGNALKTVSCV